MHSLVLYKLSSYIYKGFPKRTHGGMVKISIKWQSLPLVGFQSCDRRSVNGPIGSDDDDLSRKSNVRFHRTTVVHAPRKGNNHEKLQPELEIEKIM